ncbi:MAG: hypothetical protein DCC75_13075 [Proteobacteria bacterium]|nr:MAG: hypothetical protein DCC75_13075 [Pseudomonadota bacterium]
MIEDALRFQGGFEIQVQLEGADLPDYGYRRRVAFHIAPDGKIGFYKHGTNALVEIDRCLILMQELNLALTNYGPAISKYGTLFADLILEKESLIWVALRAREKASIEAVQDALSELKLVIPNLRVYFNEKPLFQQQDFKELQSAHPVGRFSQVNAVGNEVLKRTVTVLSKSDSVTELYAGAGNFSLPLAELGKKVQAIEIDPELVRAGNELSLQSGFGDLIKFYQISCERFIKDHKVSAEIVLDPPRSGAKEVVRLLRPESTSRIIYISCNLPSLVRDLKILSCQGYKLEQVKMIDMFAQTHHVETVSVLSS